MGRTFIPDGYESLLGIYDTQAAIELIKRFPADEQDKCRLALMSVVEQIREIVGGNE